MFDFLKHFIAHTWLTDRSVNRQATPAIEASQSSVCEPEFVVADLTNWHGHHWTDLLSAPMDARHYVLEDWGNS